MGAPIPRGIRACGFSSSQNRTTGPASSLTSRVNFACRHRISSANKKMAPHPNPTNLVAQLPPWAQLCHEALLRGDLLDGFRRFEGRQRQHLPGVRWTGQPLARKTIMLKGMEGG